ncbi:MAG: PKD domain-containing protein, partial [Candidatus Thermoplasmatota archaeon]|nr:PKD domain-containing protein [Candidatus Thermoplasmatota archaeon]
MKRRGGTIKKILPIIIILFITSFTNISYANSNINNIIYVDDNGGANYTSIQQAIDNANIGDMVYAYNGTYYENIIIDKEIVLTGEDKTNTIINGNNDNVIHINSDNVKINEFTISNGLNGIYITNSSSCTISSNTIINNKIGINIDNLSDDNLIYHNNFFNNINSACDNGDNKWYDIQFREGNYWDDFDEPSEGAYDNNTNRIVDNPYNLTIGFNQDLYPLIEALTDHPIANFNYFPYEPFTYQLIEFNDTSFDPDGYIISWLWDFGNGNISDLKNTTTKYIDEGIYNITLTVTDNYGVMNNNVKQIKILNSKPIAKFSYSPNQPNDIKDVTFFDESYDNDGGIVKWEWDLGDGTTLMNPKNPREISHKYEDNGTYKVTLTVYDNDRANNSTSIDIIVLNVKPTASFYYRPVNIENLLIIEKEEVKFYDTSKDEDGEIVRYNWNFGDDSTSNLTSPIHIFEKGGTYNLILTIYDNDGDSDTKQMRVTVLTKYHQSDETSFPTGMSLIVIIIIIFILVLVGIA